MSINAKHAGAEKTVCYIVVSTETPQTTTNPSQTLLPVFKLAHLPLPHSKSSPPRPPPPPQPLAQPFLQMRYRCKYQVLSIGPNILEVYIIYLHVYVSVDEILSHIACATTQISLYIFKVCQDFRCWHTQSMDVDKTRPNFKSSWWSKMWSCLYLHPYFACASSESSGETLKMHKLI